MKLQTRAVLMVIAVVVVTVGIASSVLTWQATTSALDSAIFDAGHEAASLGHMSSLALRNEEYVDVLATSINENDDITVARFLSRDGVPISDPGPELLDDLPDAEGTAELVAEANRSGHAVQRRGFALDVVVPVNDPAGQAGYLQMVFDLDDVGAAIRQTVSAALVLTLAVLGVGIALAIALSRRVTGPVQQVISAASELEAGTLDPTSLDAMAERSDELGTLATQFQVMSRQVIAREKRLSAQVEALQIEIDESRRNSDVESITEAPTFKDLEAHGREIRERRRSAATDTQERPQ